MIEHKGLDHAVGLQIPRGENAELVEWAVVTLILLMATVLIMVSLRNEVLVFLDAIFERLGEEPPDSYIINTP